MTIMTEEEKQSIISEILSAIRTNSLTIDDLTQLDTMPSDAYIEISGGRRISCETLKQAVASLFEKDIDLQNANIANINKAITDEAKRATQAENNLATDITAEASRAQKAEVELRNSISVEAKRAGEAELELERRLMGTSGRSNSNTDPYKYLGQMTYDELNSTLNSLTYNPDVTGKNFGYFRAKVDYRDVEIKNILLSSSLNIIVQVVKGMFVVTDNKLTISDGIYSILMRKCTNGVWGDWSIIVNSNSLSLLQDSSAANATEITNLKSQVTAINESIAKPSGIAPLDANGKVPAGNLPAFVDDMVEFNDIVQTANVEPRELPILGNEGAELAIYYSSLLQRFIVYNPDDGLYYTNWAGDENYQSNYVPLSGKIFVCINNNLGYRWSGTQLAPIGSELALGETSSTAFAGDRGVVLEKGFATLRTGLGQQNVTICNYNAWKNTPTSIYTIDAIIADLINVGRLASGMVLTFLSEDGWISKQYVGAENLSAFRNLKNWKDFGGSSVGNIYNVTTEMPISGYYTLCDTQNPTLSAVHVAWSKDKAALGLILSFEITAGVWKTYQYTGRTLAEDSWLNVDNWEDFGSLAAGSETHIVIDTLIGAPSVGEFYTLESAVTALLAYQKEKGVTYAKQGLVISYKVAENTMETKQFQGAVSDFGEVALWKDFGGGGNKIELSDAPETGTGKAFSAEGAYNYTPTKIDVDTETEGVVKLVLKNAAGDTVGDEVQFPVGTGTGGGSATIVAIAFKNSPLYGAYGANIATSAAIRSVSSATGVETENSIERIEIVDRDTNVTVFSQVVNQQSSADLTDYSFPIDFTQFFTAAGSKKYRLVAYDDTGATGSKNITVTAVDVTCTCVQVLQHSADNPITPTTTSVSVPLYKFANNQSDKGISAQVDIKIGGEWQPLATAIVNDSFTHSVTIRPTELRLLHGSYPIRIQGTDVASGTKGNTIYSAIMVVEDGNTTPIVSLRYDDANNGTIRLYDTLTLDVAVYVPGKVQSHVAIYANGTQFTQLLALNTRSYSVTQQIKGYADGERITYNAIVANVAASDNIDVVIDGSAIDAELTAGTIYDFDFSSRSNDEADHSIKSNGYELKLKGANYTTNGFGKFLGRNCLRIAENVTATLNHYMFGSSMLEATGGAIQFTFASKNVKDKTARLIECYDETSGAGFYVTGSKVGIYCKNGVRQREERSYEQGKIHTAAIVVEPTNIFIERGGIKYSRMNLYLDGEHVALIGYVGGAGNLFQENGVNLYGVKGDFYLYNICAWNTYFEWAQAHKNHLVRLTDTELMVKEFEFENVLVSQTAEGTTMLRPSATLLYARGIPYVVEVASEESFNEFDGGTSTSDNFTIDLYYYDPLRPWRSFVARGIRKRRQGTTSAKRPKKNPRYYLDKAKSIEPLFPDYTNADAILTYALFKKKLVRVGENTIPVNIITVKIDFSDSSGVNDCGTCDMMNYTYRSLGGDYLTPAQRFFDGTFDIDDIHIEGLQMNHSTANHPVAVYRSTSDTLQNVYFEARGNWKEDKGEQTALGFMNTPGYNLGCLNYQDESFIEFIGNDGETIDQIEARFKTTEGLDTSMPYLLSLYCGRNYRFMRYIDGQWKNTTGSMYQPNGKGGKWVVEGDVLNPVEGFELLVYQGFCWWRGVSSVADMMAPSTMKSSWVQKLIDKGEISGDTFPAWTYYFECMVDNDQLAIDYALGKKVPYQLYDMLHFCHTCDKSYYAQWQENWRTKLHLHANPKSVMSYYGFTDYGCGKDQQAKNMQPMWFLEDGASVINGIYSANALIMYLNKIYDADGVNDKDNDGGCDTDPEVDPGKPSTDTYTNPFAGWNSILWVCCREQQEVLLADGSTIDLRTVIAAMRSCQAEVDGQMMKPFSPDGAIYFYCTKRQLVWPKVVSSYDGYRKYIQYTATSDSIYFYALQGLGLTSLPAFIRTRWRIRDGYYQTGDFFSGVLSGRIACGADATITITAAATGYFGVGNDASGNLSESCYLEAGQSHTFTNFAKDEGALLYIYQADRMSSIDLSALTLSENFDFSVMSLVETIIAGGENHVERSMGYNKLTAYMLGDLPFLTTLDIRNTGAKSLDVSKCPRIEHIYAQGSALESITLAETSPINDIALPDTMVELRFLGLPELTFTALNSATGLQISSLGAVQRLRLENSPKLNAVVMMRAIIANQSTSLVLAMVRIVGQTLKGDGTELLTLIEKGIAGQDADGNKVAKPVINGTYQLTVIREAYEIEAIEEGISEITILVVIDAYIDLIEQVNNEAYGGAAEVETVTLDNIAEHLEYYNGETYDEYLAQYAEDNSDINNSIY